MGIRRWLVAILAVLVALLAPLTAQAAPGKGGACGTGGVSCGLPESDAEGPGILSNRYPGYWWDHPDPTAAGAGRRAVEYGIRTDRGLSTQERSLLMAWLNGDSLSDPRLVAWVDAATMGHPVEGAGPLARGPAAPPCR